jgi:hypothetical protein
MKVLKRTLRKVLAFWNRLRIGVTFNDKAPYSTLAKLDRETHSDRPSADDGDRNAQRGRIAPGDIIHEDRSRLFHSSRERSFAVFGRRRRRKHKHRIDRMCAIQTAGP